MLLHFMALFGMRLTLHRFGDKKTYQMDPSNSHEGLGGDSDGHRGRSRYRHG